MVATLRRQTTMFVLSGKGIESFNIDSLTVSTGYELLWCSYSFDYFIYHHCTTV